MAIETFGAHWLSLYEQKQDICFKICYFVFHWRSKVTYRFVMAWDWVNDDRIFILLLEECKSYISYATAIFIRSTKKLKLSWLLATPEAMFCSSAWACVSKGRAGEGSESAGERGQQGPNLLLTPSCNEALRGGVEFHTPVLHHPVQSRMAISLRKFKTSHAVKSRRPLITAQEALPRVSQFMTGKWINDQFGVYGNRLLKRKAKHVVSDYALPKQKGCICVPLRMHIQYVCMQKSIYISQGDDRTFHKED